MLSKDCFHHDDKARHDQLEAEVAKSIEEAVVQERDIAKWTEMDLLVWMCPG